MIGREDQWIATINEEDIYPDEFRMLSIKESADLSLPIAHLQFTTKDRDKVRRYTDPGYIVKIGIGKNEPDPVAEFIVVTKEVATFLGSDQWILDIWLILNSMDYYKTHRTQTYDSWKIKRSSSEVFSTIARRNGFTVDTASSFDRMLWVQHNISDRKFLEEVCSHGWFGSGKPAIVGFRMDGKAIYKPIDLLLKPRGKMGNVDGLEEKDLKLNEFTMKVRDGLLSTWVGKERRIPIHNLETEADSVVIGSLQSKIADEAGLFETTRYAPATFQNDNIHSYWHHAEAQNLQYKASISAMSFGVRLHGEYRDIHVLDCYQNIWEGSETRAAITELSGKWLATEVTHRIETNHYQTDIRFSREKLYKDV